MQMAINNTRKVFLMLVLLCLSAASFAQIFLPNSNGWKYYGLKGRVKTMTVKTKAADGNNYDVHTTYEFSEDGAIVIDYSESTVNKYSYSKDKQGKVVLMTRTVDSSAYSTKFEYDSQGYLVKTTEIFSEEGDLPRTEYFYDKSGKLTGSHSLNYMTYNNCTSKYTYDNVGSLIRIDNRWDEDSYSTWDIHSYDDHGNIIRTESYDSDQAKPTVTTYSHTYDEQGNILKTTKIDVTNGNKATMTEYGYIYY